MEKNEEKWECPWDPTGKCRWVGFLKRRPRLGSGFCICCQVLELRERLEDLGWDLRSG